MVGFFFISWFIALQWAVVHFVPDAVAVPASMVPAMIKFFGVLVQLDVAFPVQEMFVVLGITGAIYLSMGLFNAAHWVYQQIPVIGGHGA